MLTLAGLTRRLSLQPGERPIPLLVFRLPEFERIAWREGRPAARRLEAATTAAFAAAALRSLRAGDVCAHDRRSDVYAVAMCAASRRDRAPAALDCRAALERIAVAISLVRDLTVSSGWTIMHGPVEQTLDRHISAALERGVLERERHDFFAAVGHELRTPLTSISGYLETLLGEPLCAATRRRFLQTARREALRLERLLDGMFAFSLLDLTIGPSGPACSLARELDAAIEAIRPAARKRRMHIVRALIPEVEVAMPADACTQVLGNLLGNAVKYGRERGTIEVSAGCRMPLAFVSIDDDGPGIVPSEREAIFGLGVRGASVEKRPGSGIGLALVRAMLRHVGGDIRVGPSPLGGARFDFTVPLAGRNR